MVYNNPSTMRDKELDREKESVNYKYTMYIIHNRQSKSPKTHFTIKQMQQIQALSDLHNN